jgi:hypothetical protein
MLQWLLTVVALLVAGIAIARTRRLARRLDRLTESYWELRYEEGQLRARLSRLDPETTTPAADPPRPQGTSFVPLSSLKR